MHIPVFSAHAASKRWNGGAPELMTEGDLVQAQKDAPYWAQELRAGNMPAFDIHTKKMQDANEAYHLERFHFLSYINNDDFWNALVEHLNVKTPTFWLPAIDSAIESGNVHALHAIKTHAGLPLQTLFFEWLTYAEQCKNVHPPHPQALQWFAQDASLHELLRAFSESSLARDYSTAILTGEVPLWWDAANQTSGAASVLSWTQDWCALPETLRTTEGAVKNALSLLTCLNKRDMDRARQDPMHTRRASTPAQALSAALEQSVARVCEAASLPPELMRTLAGRMTAEDFENPLLCAVVQYQDPFVTEDWFCTMQHRQPLRTAQYKQVVHNASRAEPLPALLDMQCQKGVSWGIYGVAEPFISKRAVQSMALPEGLLDTSAFNPN